MIELRWIVTGDKSELQYRQWQFRIDAAGAITPLPLPIEWTDWKNIECFVVIRASGSPENYTAAAKSRSGDKSRSQN